MATDLGSSAPPVGAPALRASRSGWRDPRLWVGVLIVVVSVVAGARLLSAADDTVAVWAVSGDLGAGDEVDPGALVATRVRFADDDRLADYFTADETLPADLELVRGVGAGELLPRAAVGDAGESGTVQLPVAVDSVRVPGSVGPGSVVDLYVVPSLGAGGPDATDAADAAPPPGADGKPALHEVTVVDAPAAEEGFAATGQRQLVLAVDERDAHRFFRLLAGSDSPVLTVVRRG